MVSLLTEIRSLANETSSASVNADLRFTRSSSFERLSSRELSESFDRYSEAELILADMEEKTNRADERLVDWRVERDDFGSARRG